MTVRARKMYFMTPTFRPVGGVVKIFDYVNHAMALGYAPVVACPERYKPGLQLFENERFSRISPENGVRFTGLEQAAVGPDDFAFVSWPTHYRTLEPKIGRWAKNGQVICIVQNVRWANPLFEGGYAVRLLSRPLAWITTNDVVLESVRPYLNDSLMARVIDLGHDSGFFAKARSGPFGSPVKVGYTTWKSDVGDRVAAMFGKGSGFKFRAIRNPVGWKDLRKLYQWADVFLATPLIEEGFYMPGLEAMAAGAVVLSPDAGGNRAYCDFGNNCLPVAFEDPVSYAAVLKTLAYRGAGELDRLRGNGYETIKRHTLEGEREGFGGFMRELTGYLESPGAPPPGAPPPGAPPPGG